MTELAAVPAAACLVCVAAGLLKLLFDGLTGGE